MMNWHDYVIAILIFGLVMTVIILGHLLRINRQRVKDLVKENNDLNALISYNKTRLSSSSRDTMIAQDRAKKNQERWIKFRNDMTRLYALHEYAVIGSADAMERVAEWNQLSVADQAEWLKRGTEFVERNYGSFVG